MEYYMLQKKGLLRMLFLHILLDNRHFRFKENLFPPLLFPPPPPLLQGTEVFCFSDNSDLIPNTLDQGH